VVIDLPCVQHRMASFYSGLVNKWNFIDAASKRVIIEAARKRWELNRVWMLVEIRFSSLEEQLE